MHKRSDRDKKTGTFRKFSLFVCCAVLVLLLTGCSMSDIIHPVLDFFSREASMEETTAPVLSENDLVAAPVKDLQGKELLKKNGEAVTVMAAYETASGGELRRDASGETVVYAPGEVMTYAANAPVIRADGTYETYAGGEQARDFLGFQIKDGENQPMTRAAGEVVTHGQDAVMYDENGEMIRSNGEPATYQKGEFLYDDKGEPVTYPVLVSRDENGEAQTDEEGVPVRNSIELVTDDDGNPVTEKNEEAATRQLEPQPPERILEPPVEEGTYYLKNTASTYLFFSIASARTGDLPVSVEEGAEQQEVKPEELDKIVDNLQLELPGDENGCFELQYDPEGYAVFSLQGTDRVLTAPEKLAGGGNITLEDRKEVIYPQYKYWDDPLTTVADNQRWIIRSESDGTYRICSAMDPSYVMTADDQWGVQNANIILWKYDGRDMQRFAISTDQVVIPRYIEEGSYVIRNYLTDWMLISLGDGNYADGTTTYLNPSDQGDGQRFYIAYDKYGFAVIYHGDSNKVLSVGSANAVDNQIVCQYEYDGGDWQKWVIEPDKNGGYNIRSLLNLDQVIDLNDGATTVGQEVHLYHDNQTLAQCWDFETDPIASPYTYAYMDDYAQNFSSMTDYLILVSSDTNHVGVYQGYRGNWTNLFYWDCVTGKESTPTVKGEFYINVKSESFDGNMDSPYWYTVYYTSSFYPDYFFHSIIYLYHTWTVMDASMGFSASHGCVRLDTDNALWIYENVPLDTKVVSY